MEENAFPPSDNMFCSSPDSMMDLDLDKLLVDGCWLGTNDGSEFLSLTPTSNATYDPSVIWDILEDNIGESSWMSTEKDSQDEQQRSSFSANLSTSQPLVQNSSQMQWKGKASNTTVNKLVEGSELSKKWWIGPKLSHGRVVSVVERLIQAIGYLKSITRDSDALLQIWVPVNKGGVRVLSTTDQPFSIDHNSPSLASYREISVSYQFSADEDSRIVPGLPGRVFMGKVPEWSPDVRLFRSEEYPRVGYAQQYGVRGSLAVPVFEQGSSNCLGVIEVITTAQKINYMPELESVCKALEAVDLRGSEVASMKIQNVKICDNSYQAALPEILEVLRSACETHRLPLAQTWVPCVQQGKEGCRHSDKNVVHCVSTLDSACCIGEPSIREFHRACSEHHLLKGQGVVGRAFRTNQPCFSSDVTSSSKTEYPLSHHARMIGLRAAVAIRLRSIYTGKTDFVLEFFLPMDCRDPQEQTKLLNSLSIIFQNNSFSLQSLTDRELREETIFSEIAVASDSIHGGQGISEVISSEVLSHEVSYRSFASNIDSQENTVAPFSVENPNKMLREHALAMEHIDHDPTSSVTVSFGHTYSSSDQCSSFLKGSNTRGKRHTKSDKYIALEMLQQYFAGSLKDAAKSLGVSPTTLKRICRQYGISRWPCRTIKKVDHSLKRIQGVMNSVRAASGGYQLKFLYPNFPEPGSPDLAKTSSYSAVKQNRTSMSLDIRHNEGGTFSSEAAISKSSTSSCSQSSSSSQCCSSDTQCTMTAVDHKYTGPTSIPNESVVKRVNSAAELHASNNEAQKLLPRARSYKSLLEHRESENLPTLPKNNAGNLEGHMPSLRVKVTYGEEKARFSMQDKWGYKDLLWEVLKRFGIGDESGFQLKYLDDECEWIMLTCDEDMGECLDLCRSVDDNIIKLSLHQRSQQRNTGSSLGQSSWS